MTTTYCTYTELANLTGSTLSQTILEAIINEAEREVNDYLALSGLTGVAGNAMKSATLKLSIAGLITRRRMDGTQPGSLTLDGSLVTSDNLDAAISGLRKAAFAILDNYIMTAAGVVPSGLSSRVNLARRVDYEHFDDNNVPQDGHF